MATTIRPLAQDLDCLMAVMDDAFDPVFGEAWSRRQVHDALVLGNCHLLLADAAGGVPRASDDTAGFALVRHILGEEELLLFAVSHQYRRRGLGRRLLESLIRQAHCRGANRIFLEMRRGNPAETLYRGCGFIPVGERKNYYKFKDGRTCDAITFALEM